MNLEKNSSQTVNKKNQQEQEQSERDQSSQDYRQAAFDMNIDSQCESIQKEAVNYILNVRQEANRFKIDKAGFEAQAEEQEIKEQKEMIIQVSQYPIWFEKWKEQTINNFKIVIANAKYVLKQQNFIEKIDKKLNFEQKPKLIDLTEKMNLYQIQEKLAALSEEYLQKKSNPNLFYLWLYSLLAVHQSKASYIHFQSLGSINSYILNDTQNSAQKLTLGVILFEYFHQKHLKQIFKFS